MKVGFIGLGKLGLPTAMAMEAHGHDVVGWDPSPQVARTLQARELPYVEAQATELLEQTRIELVPPAQVARRSEIIFVTIQTPHAPLYEGITRLPEARVDFDYTYLIAGLRELARDIEAVGEDRIVVLVSTVLPGTVRREIRPFLGKNVRLCYNPFFIAMGTTIPDFLNPEFVLLGVDDAQAADAVERFYGTIHRAPVFRTTVENAELVKVLYNTFISTKVAFANTVMELCHRLPGCDADEVVAALGLARERIISTRYLSGGMGDGGGCHPRDNIALSWLSRELGLSYDWFDNIMRQRERQTDWLADLAVQHAQGRPIVILGRAFKAGCNLEIGSPSLLLRNLLEERGVSVAMWDPYIDPPETCPRGRSFCYVVGTRHPEFRDFAYEPGSVVLDPWRYVPDRAGVTVVRIGQRGHA